MESACVHYVDKSTMLILYQSLTMLPVMATVIYSAWLLLFKIVHCEYNKYHIIFILHEIGPCHKYCVNPVHTCTAAECNN